jgi:hypothetical protein
MTVLTLLYPIVTNTALGLFACSSTTVTVQAYLGLDQDGSALHDIGVDPAVAVDPSLQTPALLNQLLEVKVCQQCMG